MVSKYAVDICHFSKCLHQLIRHVQDIAFNRVACMMPVTTEYDILDVFRLYALQDVLYDLDTDCKPCLASSFKAKMQVCKDNSLSYDLFYLHQLNSTKNRKWLHF